MRVVRRAKKINLKQWFSVLWSTSLATLFLFALLYSKAHASSTTNCTHILALGEQDEEPGMGEVIVIKPDPVEKQPEIDPRTVPQPELPLEIVPVTPEKKHIPAAPPINPNKIPLPPPKPKDNRWNIN